MNCVVPAKKCEDTGVQLSQEMLKEIDGVTSQVSNIIKTGYKLMDLIYFFTAGDDEVKCWSLRRLSKAPQAAGRIHTDFERGFICAETMSYDDFVRLGCKVAAVKDDGKYRQ